AVKAARQSAYAPVCLPRVQGRISWRRGAFTIDGSDARVRLLSQRHSLAELRICVPSAASIMARMPALTTAGRSGQAFAIFVSSGECEVIQVPCKVVGTTRGTSEAPG